MSTIYVRTHQSIGGRATCPCGWVITTTKSAAYHAAVDHNDHVHNDEYNISVNFKEQTS